MRGYAIIGLDNPKTPANVGGALRACGCFDATAVMISGLRMPSNIGKIPTDTQKAWRHIPVTAVNDLRDVIPYNCVPVGVEITDDAKSLHTYKHPERAFYIFGAEDATLGDRVLGWCRDVIQIPSNYCLNLAACVNVVLYDRSVKLSMQQNDRR